jgi:hypothetical protein
MSNRIDDVENNLTELTVLLHKTSQKNRMVISQAQELVNNLMNDMNFDSSISNEDIFHELLRLSVLLGGGITK